MGLEGLSSVDVHALKQALCKLNEKLSEEQAMFLSRYIGKGRQSIPIENLLEVLQLADAGSAVVDSEWQEKFLMRMKKKMNDKNIMEE